MATEKKKRAPAAKECKALTAIGTIADFLSDCRGITHNEFMAIAKLLNDVKEDAATPREQEAHARWLAKKEQERTKEVKK